MIDTIFAQASARGAAGVAVIRVSGPDAFRAGAAIAGGLGEPRQAVVRWLRDQASGTRLDQAVVVAFPRPGSFTGEDLVEFQVHGSQAVCRAVLAALGQFEGLRSAEPGEFTRRALMNGRLDLSQVEGLADLLVAETEAQRCLALDLMRGVLSCRAEEWRAALLRSLAFVEAAIDFPDEELPADLLLTVMTSLRDTLAAMEAEVAGSRMAERVREGFEVALVGRPNVGKSTLLNTLAGRGAALTSEVAGTTRDVIEVRMEVAGLALTVLDMAGLREKGDDIEAMGVARARERAAAADLRIFLVENAADVAGLGIASMDGDLTVLAKADLRPVTPELAVSGLTGAGIDSLVAAVAAALEERKARAGTASHQRQRDAVASAAAAIESALAELDWHEPRVELAAEELRAALRALDFLVGKVDVEAVLDVVFQSFCLGK